MLILGISAYCHDSAAALVNDGDIVADAQEERFTRKKHDAGFPANAIQYCLQEARATLADVDCIVFCEKPLVKFARVLETNLEKFYLKTKLKKELVTLAGRKAKSPQLICIEHARADATLAPYQHAMGITLGDAGSALGAALAIWCEYLGNNRSASSKNNAVGDAMSGGYLGPWFASNSIAEYLDSINAPFKKLADAELMSELSDVLASEKIVGWFQGRMEFGPCALGGRSIIGDPRSAKMQSVLNLKTDHAAAFGSLAYAMTAAQQRILGLATSDALRSQIPGVTHVDYAAHIQTVRADTNPRFYQLLESFEQKTGCPVLVNASFNARGEPIVCTPADAYRCFMRTELDCLVLEDLLLYKREQPVWEEESR